MSTMITNTELPDVEEFITWVKRSIADLNMRPSHFLRDDTPGSINRVSRIFGSPASLKLSVACRLENEIRAAAQQQGIELLPMRHSLAATQVN